MITVRYPFAEGYVGREEAWDQDDWSEIAYMRACGERSPLEHLDSLAVAGEYVAAEARVEPYWRAALGLIFIFVMIAGIGAVLFGIFG